MARRNRNPGPGQMSFFDEATNEAMSSHRLPQYEETRAIKAAPRSLARNLRPIGAQRAKEPLPPMLPFDSSRVAEAGYSAKTKVLYVRFADGTPWNYFGVEPNEWKNFRRSASPGRFINRVLNSKDYGRGEF